MSLSNITFVPQEQANLVVQAKAGLLKVASAASGALGTVQAEGVASGAVSWSLLGNPGGAISISAQAGDPTKADITFAQVPIRTEPWLVIVQASTMADGKTIQIPLAILVREAFTLKEVTRPAGDFTVVGQTCDPDLATLSFKGYGPGGATADVNFMPPTGLPTGLSFGVDDDNTAYLTPASSSLADPTGGIKGNTGVSYAITLRAYRAGTLYDTPEDPATVTVTYDLTAGPRVGTLAFSVGGSYDPTSTQGVLLDAVLAYVKGRAPIGGFTTEWLVSGGALGSWSPSSLGAQALSAAWIPSAGAGAQDVTFTVNVKEAGVTVATAVVGPFPITDATDWSATDAAKVVLYPAKLYPQEAGKKVYFRVSMPELTAAETALVTITLTPVGAAGAIVDGPTPFSILGSGDKFAVVGFTVPVGAGVYDMWQVGVSAAVTGGSQDRTGYGQLLAFSTGKAPLIIQMADNTLSGATGSHLTPVTLRAYRWAQNALPATPTDAFLNPLASVANSTLVEVQGISYRVMGAPEGVAPVFQANPGIFQLGGLLRSAGTFSFAVQATNTNYQSLTDSAEQVTLVTAAAQTRVGFSAFSTTNPTVAGGQGFTLSWGIQGTGTVTLQGNNHLPPADVTGVQSTSVGSILDSTAYILRGSNALGETLSSPVLVQLGATGSSTQLPPSPTIASIDEHELCSVVWQPSPIGNSYAAYDYWQISAKDAVTGSPYLITKPPSASSMITGLETVYGGTLDSRKFEFSFTALGYHELSMKAIAANIPGVLSSQTWDSFKAFPAPRTVTLDKTTASKGEAIALTIGAPDLDKGGAGDRWQAVYSDGTASEWFPMSITSVAKSFAVGGAAQTIKLVIESDYATAYPPVKLRRTLTQSVFVQDQDFQGATDTFDLSGATIGVGGETGFQVTNNLDGTKVPMPYMVVAPALVRDDVTNELKLMVATARSRDASSVLGTMAIDVFPLAGRPHTLDLVKLPDKFIRTDGVLYNPVSITQDALPDVIVGQNITPVQLQAAGGLKPYRWFSLELPFGLSLSRDGRLSGTAQKLGRFALVVSVQDSQSPSSIAEKVLYLTAKSDLAIIPPVLTDPIVGTEYSGLLQAEKGIQPYTWELVAGKLPSGLTLGIDGSITGWPVTYNTNADMVNDYVFVAQVTDALGAKASKQLTLKLLPMALAITAPDQDTIIQGESFKLRFPVVGGTPGYTLVGQPIAPIGFVASTRIINGMIELTTRDSFRSAGDDSVHIGLRARDTKGTEVYTEYTIQVRPEVPVARWIIPSLSASVRNGGDAQQITLQGAGTGVSYDAVEVLPPPTTLTVTTDVARGIVAFSGPVTGEGNPTPALRATLKQGNTVLGKLSRDYNVLTNTAAEGALPVWTASVVPTAVGAFFAFDIQAPGINPPTPSAMTNKVRLVDGETLPAGVSLDECSGMLYGALHSTIHPSTTMLEVVDAAGDAVSGHISIKWTNVVDGTLQVQGSLPYAEVGRTFDATLNVLGATGTISAQQLPYLHLPLGLSMSIDGQSVRITGRPLETGYFDLWLQVYDTQNRKGLFYGRLVVDYLPYLAVTTTELPTIIQGFSYSTQLAATGGKPGYTWELGLGQTLPEGITLSGDGILQGTTSVAAFDSPVLFIVTDSYGQTAEATIDVVVGVAPALIITTNTLPPGVVGAPYIGAQVQAIGGVPAYAWSTTNLPAGLALDPVTGIITGTPTAPNAVAVDFKVRDSLNVETTKAVTLTIMAAGAFRVATDTIPQGRMAQAYGATGSATPSFWLASVGSPRVGGFSVPVQFGSKTYLLCGGGNCATLTADAVSQPIGTIQVFDPDVVVGGVQVGQYAALVTPVQSLNNPYSNPMGAWNLQDRIFAASVQISPTEFVLIGGARMGGSNSPVYSGPKGRALQDSNATDGSDVTTTAMVCFVKTTMVSNQRTLQLTPGPKLASGAGAGVGEGRYGMAGSLLQDGRVFACGGVAVLHNAGAGTSMGTSMDARITGKEAFVMSLGVNRAQSSWTRVADMPVGLVCAQAVTLPNGKVLVLGGLVRSGVGYTDPLGSTTSLIYDPVADTWTPGPALPFSAFTHSAVVLADGRVLCSHKRQRSTDPDGGIYALDAALTTWTQFISASTSNGILAPMRWGSMVALEDGTGIWQGGTPGGNPGGYDWSKLTSGATTFAFFVPDYTNYPTEADLLAADYAGSYPWAAPDGQFSTCLFNTNTLNTIKLQAEGGITPYNTWSASALPDGITLNSATGVLSGTPTAPFDQDVNFSAHDSTAPAAGGPLITPLKPIRFTIIDADAPIWVTKSVDPGYLEEAYSVQLVAKDGLGTTLTGNFSISPVSPYGLPPGITLNLNGTLSGTTSKGWAREVIFRVANPAAPTKYTDQKMAVNFSCNTQIPQQVIPAVTPLVPWSYQLLNTGGKGPFTWGATALPSGLVLGSTGLLSGTADAQVDKDSPVSFQVTDPNGCTDTQVLYLRIRNAQFTITPNPLQAVAGQAYTQTLTCTGGTGPYTWTIKGLPAGFTYNSQTGVVSSALVTALAATYPLTVTVKDATGAVFSPTINLVVTAPAYAWYTGAQVSQGLDMPLYTQAGHLAVLGVIDRRFSKFWDYSKRGADAPGWLNGDPWTIVIRANFKTAQPTLQVNMMVAGAVQYGMGANLISMNAERTEARYGVSWPTALSTNWNPAWDETCTMECTLTDGTATSHATMKIKGTPWNTSHPTVVSTDNSWQAVDSSSINIAELSYLD